jgi:2-polyprenyl-3-methyl-5-hydroxy-6-metoxy-1,4-benzoquinol methylase
MPDATSVEQRARASAGRSDAAIYRMVGNALAARGVKGGRVIDVGCGHGAPWTHLKDRFSEYVGVDVVRYDGFPEDGTFVAFDLDAGSVPLDDATGDVVIAVETVEHLENPRAFVRDLVRLAKPGGWVVVTTPNQLSWLSLSTLLAKKQFSHLSISCGSRRSAVSPTSAPTTPGRGG